MSLSRLPQVDLNAKLQLRQLVQVEVNSVSHRTGVKP